MAEIATKKPFRHAVLTVGSAALVAAGVIFYLVRLREWAASLIIILVPALVLLPLISARYKEGPRPEPTPEQHRKSAILWGSLSLVCILTNLLDHRTGWNAVLWWALAIGWLVQALQRLRRAHRGSIGGSGMPQ